MRTWIVGGLALVLTVGVLPAQAVEPLGLYDDFHGTQLDPAKWAGDQSAAITISSLPVGGLLDAVREVLFGRLRLGARYYGSPSLDTGAPSGRLRLSFTKPAPVTAIDATLLVTRAEAVGCASNQEFAARAQARLSGFFFNTTTPPTPIVGNTNDVFAFVRVQRWSDSTDPEHVLQIVGFVLLCLDPYCNGTSQLGTVSLGTVYLWQPVRLRIQWDQANHRFIFQRGHQAEVYVDYIVPDIQPSLFPFKRVELAHEVPNCTTAPRANAFMELLVDKVLVNQSAVPLP
jgi:hypothetical protein